MTIDPSPEALTAAWRELPSEAQEAIGGRFTDTWRRIIKAALADVDRQYRLSDDRHLVKVQSDGWTVQHPQSCRPNLFTCPWSDPTNMMVGRAFDSGRWPDRESGVYVGDTIPDPHGLGTVRLVLGDLVFDVPPEKPCSYPGCGKPTAYLPHRDNGQGNGWGEGWRHVDPADETSTHVGYPMSRTADERTE